MNTRSLAAFTLAFLLTALAPGRTFAQQDNAIGLSAPGMVAMDTPFTLTISITAHGPDDGAFVETETTVPDEFEFQEPLPDGCDAFNHRVLCSETSVPVETTFTFEVTVIATEEGIFTVESEIPVGIDDPDPDNNGPVTIEIEIGQVRLGSISGTVFRDINNNGIQDAGEPGEPYRDILVNASVAATSGADGFYMVSGLEAGNYTVSTIPIDMESITLGEGDYFFELAEGENKTEIDFGVFKPSVITGLVWHDLDANAARNGTEPGVAGVTVYLFKGCNLDISAETVTSDAPENGLYAFDGLTADTYCVGVNHEFPLSGNPDDAPFQLSLPTNVSGLQIVELGYADAGFASFGIFDQATITGTVWRDLDEDGSRGENDPPVEGRTIVLKDSEGKEIARTTTDSAGTYVFKVDPGTYTVEEEYPDDTWEQTYPGDGGAVTIAGILSIDTREGIDFGDRFIGTDVAISKTFEPETVVEGDTLRFTLEVSNLGSTDAENVTATDDLNTEFHLVSVSTTAGSCQENDGDVSCELGTLGPGVTETITITVVVGLPGIRSNLAQVTTTSPDVNPENNESFVEIIVFSLQLDITATALVHQTCINGVLPLETSTTDGNRVTITVSVTNGSAIRSESAILRFLDGETGRTLPDGSGDVGISVPPEQTVDASYVWNTTGFTWKDDGTAHVAPRQIHVELIRNGKLLGAVEIPVTVLPKPLILVHGLWADASTWNTYPTLALQLHPGYAGRVVQVGGMQTGHDPSILKSDFGNRHEIFSSTTIAQNAGVLAGEIETVRSSLNACHVDVVAHSMGGLISRKYIDSTMPQSEVDGEQQIRKLVLLGTPNQGSPCATTMLSLFPEIVSTEKAPLVIPPSNLIELTPSYLNDVFNPATTNQKSVPFHELAGAAVDYTCTEHSTGDGVVTVGSALPLTGIPFFASTGVENVLHTSMTGSADIFENFVTPRLNETFPGSGAPAPASDADPSVSGLTLSSADPPTASLVFSGSLDIPPGTEETLAFSLPEGLSNATVTILGAAGLGTSILDPMEQTVDETGTGSDQAGLFLRSHDIPVPEGGVWTLRVQNPDVDNASIVVGVAVEDDPVSTSMNVSEPDAGYEIVLTVDARENGTPLLGSTVSATISGGGAAFETILLDDGMHDDGLADDGIYGARYRPPLPDTYLFNATVTTVTGLRSVSTFRVLDSISPVAIEPAEHALPEEFGVGAAYPNPTAHDFELPVSLKQGADVTIDLVDMLGKQVATLYRGHLEGGITNLTLETDRIPAGVYALRGSIGGKTFVRLLTILR